MSEDVSKVKNLFDITHWCWSSTGKKFSNRELFSFAQNIAAQTEIDNNDLHRQIAKAHAQHENSVSKNAQKQLEQYTAKQLEDAVQKIRGTKGGRHAQRHDQGLGKRGQEVGNGEQGPGSREQRTDHNSSIVQQAAQAALDEAAELLSEKDRQLLKRSTKHLHSYKDLFELAKKIENSITATTAGNHSNDSKKCSATGGEAQEKSFSPLQKEVYKGRHAFGAPGKHALPLDGFDRLPVPEDSRDGYEGSVLSDNEDTVALKKQTKTSSSVQLSFIKTIQQISSNYHRIKRKMHRHIEPELSSAEIRLMVDQLIQHTIISRTFSDTFLVNREKVAYLLAKNVFLQIKKLLPLQRQLRTGTHTAGTRGLQTVQPDKTQRARHITSRIAFVSTLRRGLTRRSLYPRSSLLDEEDIVEYASRKKVGYSVVIAVDISGALQFGRRIKGVRKACLAFGYYLKHYHPYDKVRFVAYHEIPREISFSQVPKLRAINGVGKDIGGCLKKCREMLLRDPDRVPVIILIGDGLPARGENAGFYRFREHNREYFDKAYENARLLRREGVLFTFLQFREDRHLWQEYSDETAQKITGYAHGTLYKINSIDDITTSLLKTYDDYKKVYRPLIESTRRHFA